MLLCAKHLEKSFRKRKVVKDVSLDVKTGEVVGLLGPNGAGKTTVFYMMVGLISADQGEIFLDDRNITDLPMYRRARQGIGYLPQEPSVFRKLTVEENLLAILETLDLSHSERQERLYSLLKELNISHLSKNKAYALSGGERRRVEITRSLVTSPHFLLLDEPFAGIDPIAIIDIQKIIGQLKAKGIGILITDHNVQETLEITDRSYIISEGEILESGTSLDIANSSKAKAIYLGEKFRFLG
ncbi:MAG TPA: LPS export ABC transporter ATP-binding protein [Nitrospiria bacterium]|nr:LPS export ABC transporter ATP-binding protein [Nitrospiria bacterium]HUK57529.1 LPS export ABC transporter ATP-binding protein [Nitrospiria bacterium]